MITIDHTPSPLEWDEYVAVSRRCGLSHLYGWGAGLATTYRLPIFRLAARRGRDGAIIGILPLLLFAAPNRPKRLISLPYSDCAGVVGDTAEVTAELLAAARELAVSHGAAHLELRQAGAGAAELADQLCDRVDCSHTVHTFKVGLARCLPSSVDLLWRDLSAKVRNQVRKAEKCGHHAEVGGGELLTDFYRVFSENMRDLGSPVHPAALFSTLGDLLGDGMRVVVIRTGSQATAAALVFFHNKTLYNPWAASLRRYRPECPNMLLYWTMLAQAVEEGCTDFDFGRSSPGAPTCRFKQQWGAQMAPLSWHVYSMPQQRWDPTCESLEIDWWKKLSLAVSRRHGPPIRRWISL